MSSEDCNSYRIFYSYSEGSINVDLEWLREMGRLGDCIVVWGHSESYVKTSVGVIFNGKYENEELNEWGVLCG